MPSLRLPQTTLHWLIVLGVFHLLTTTSVFLIGRLELLPGIVNPNGIGIGFSIDAVSYHQMAVDLVHTLRTDGLFAWWAVQAPIHARLYSLSFALIGNVVGANVLAAEPLNLLYYLVTLALVYLLGSEIFNARAGAIATAMVAIWPSFLLHSTQIMRDPLATSCLLGLLLLMTILLTRECSWRAGLAVAVATALLATLFWLTRGNMWNVVLLTAGSTSLLLVVSMVFKKKFLIWNVVAIVLTSASLLFVPSHIESRTMPGVRAPAAAIAVSSSMRPAPPEGRWNRLIRQVVTRRIAFQRFYDAGSNVDADVRLSNSKEILRYLPRAAEIGFLAPFPNMWLVKGTTGRAGRILAGIETLIMYVLYILAAVCLWVERKRAGMWLIALVATLSLIALGVVVVNVGALFRLRYAFWIMILIIAAEGIVIVERKTKGRGIGALGFGLWSLVLGLWSWALGP